MKNCLECDTPFAPNRDKKFCNRSCSATYNNRRRRIDRPCPGCGNQRESDGGTFCSRQCRNDDKLRRWLNGENFTLKWGGTPQFIRDFLLEECGHQCSQCHWKELHPVTGIVPLEVDHIDGDNYNNLRENLRILCPNCHSLTPNFRNLNRVGGRKRGKKIRPEDR